MGEILQPRKQQEEQMLKWSMWVILTRVPCSQLTLSTVEKDADCHMLLYKQNDWTSSRFLVTLSPWLTTGYSKWCQTVWFSDVHFRAKLERNLFTGVRTQDNVNFCFASLWFVWGFFFKEIPHRKVLFLEKLIVQHKLDWILTVQQVLTAHKNPSSSTKKLPRI